MKLEIIHDTEYLYSDDIFLHSQWLRLTPRDSQRQQTEYFHIDLDPVPAQSNVVQGFDGSLAHHLTFQGHTRHFRVKTTSILTTKPANAAVHLYPYEVYRIPFAYNNLERQLLEPFIYIEECPRLIRIFAENILYEANYQTLPFLYKLMLNLSQQISKEYREFGWPHPPVETLQKGAGSCRDIAVLFMTCCRYLGLAARFVSGYIFEELRSEDSELHAWVEVYLPGAGWCGYDPTYGLLAGEGHVDICASAFPELCAPLEGNFSGKASQTLHAKVTIRRLDKVAQS